MTYFKGLQALESRIQQAYRTYNENVDGATAEELEIW
jgi:hypothetical protein